MLRRIRTSLTLAVLAAALGCASSGVTFNDPSQGVRPVYSERDAVRVVVLSAVPAELDQLLEAARIDRTAEIAGRTYYIGNLEGHAVVLGLAGVSMVNAAAATQALIDYFDVGGILFSGIAGGVNPNLAIGDVTVPGRWGQHQEMVFARATAEGWDTEGRAGEFENFGMMFTRGQLLAGGGPEAQPEQRRFWFPVDEEMLDAAQQIATQVRLARCVDSGECLEHQPRIVTGGSGVSGPTFVNNAEFREWIWRTFEADAVDMETAAVAQVAALNRVRFLGFRSLSDLAGGGLGGNQIRVFGRLAADNSASVLRAFLRAWRGAR